MRVGMRNMKEGPQLAPRDVVQHCEVMRECLANRVVVLASLVNCRHDQKADQVDIHITIYPEMIDL